MNKKTAGEVRKLKDGAGRFVWADSLLPGMPSSLLGYPVVEAEDMPDIAANSLSIAFGSFQRGYTIVDRIGMRLLVDPYTNKQKWSYLLLPCIGIGMTVKGGTNRRSASFLRVFALPVICALRQGARPKAANEEENS
jgi:HK97 family phage major capsid protein